MKTYAAIKSRLFWIKGYPHSGWRGATKDIPGAIQLDFDFAITDDGGGNFLLAYSSLDGVYTADSWHETLDSAYECAQKSFGIERTEWGQP